MNGSQATAIAGYAVKSVAMLLGFAVVLVAVGEAINLGMVFAQTVRER